MRVKEGFVEIVKFFCKRLFIYEVMMVDCERLRFMRSSSLFSDVDFILGFLG